MPRAVARPLRMILQYHEVFGQWYVPNLRAYVPHERGFFVVRTNARGMRSSRDHPLSAPPGRRRLLLFGDSFTAGEGVSNDERFSDLLEGMGDAPEVLNFGLSGSGPDQQLLILEEAGERFDADAVLFCPSVENIRRVLMRSWPELDGPTGHLILVPKPYFSLADGGKLERQNVPVPRERPAVEAIPDRRLGLRLRRLLRPMLGPWATAAVRASGYQPYPQYRSASDPAWLLMRAILARMIEVAGPRRVVVAPLPLYHHIEGMATPVYLQRFRELAREHPGIELIDLLPYFQALPYRERRRCRYRHDPHYTPLAHRVVASALTAELSRRGIA